MGSKQDRSLHQSQIDVLLLLYKFRFGSRELIARSLGRTNTSAVYAKLHILLKQEYVGVRFEPSYRLAGRPAEYYLLPKGLRTLRDLASHDGLDDKAIKNSYKDKTASIQFITESLTIFAIHNQLASMYDKLQFFTKRELAGYDYFPKVLPDGFISLPAGNGTRRFFVELIASDTPPFAVDRRLRQLADYNDSDTWAVTDLPFPIILCICESGSVERRFRKQVIRLLNRSGTDLLFCTTTKPALLDSTKGDDLIWSEVTEPEALRSLTSF